MVHTINITDLYHLVNKHSFSRHLTHNFWGHMEEDIYTMSVFYIHKETNTGVVFLKPVFVMAFLLDASKIFRT